MFGQPLVSALKVGAIATLAYVVYRLAGGQLESGRGYTEQQLEDARRRYSGY